VRTILEAFDHVNLVALGERHWSRQHSEFRKALIRDPAFARKVNDIVIEFGNPLHQAILDRYVVGEDVPAADLRKVWQDTTQPGAWDSPVYEDFLVAVRVENTTLPRDGQLRVLAGDYPIDWSAITGPADLPDLDARDRSAAAIVQHEVLDRGRKALVLFGSAHVYRNRPGSVVDLLKDRADAKCFVVAPVSEATIEPGLVEVDKSSVGDLEASEVLEKGCKRIKVVDGKPVLVDGKPVFIPVFESGVRVRDLTDALLSFGGERDESVEPPASLYAGTEYGREVERRRRILISLMTPQK
jgi:hypothetical protein